MEYVKVYSIYELSDGGLEFIAVVVFPTYERPQGGRRLLQEQMTAQQIVAKAEELEEALDCQFAGQPPQCIGSVFPDPPFSRAAYGVPEVTYLDSMELVDDPPLWARPLQAGAYNFFDWLDPTVFFPATSTGNYTMYEYETMVVAFTATIAGAVMEDFTTDGLGQEYINMFSGLIGKRRGAPTPLHPAFPLQHRYRHTRILPTQRPACLRLTVCSCLGTLRRPTKGVRQSL